jgi:hypothetical protein
MRSSSVRFALGALLVSALASLVAIVLVLRSGAEPDGASAGQDRQFLNPLYPQLSAIGEREGFDTSFARWVVSKRNGPLLNHPLFSLPEHSVDVLIFGDSTAAWGITPQVVESVSHLRVAMFADPGMPLNVAECAFYRAVIDKYLAPDGCIVFYFAPKNITREPSGLHLPQLMDASHKALSRVIAPTATASLWSYDGYRDWRNDEIEQPLQALGLRLPRLTPYQTSLERLVNPDWFATKKETDAKRDKRFLRWDGWTATLHGDTRLAARRSTQTPKKLDRYLPKAERLEYTARNAEALRALPGQKYLVLPWSTAKIHYLRFRAIYAKYFAADAELIDMGKLLPRDVKYPMSDVLHMKNETGFEASVLLGKWLQKHRVARPVPKRPRRPAAPKRPR